MQMHTFRIFLNNVIINQSFLTSITKSTTKIYLKQSGTKSKKKKRANIVIRICLTPVIYIYMYIKSIFNQIKA